ncbi:MAG: hypothetical protein CVV12_03630 [Gammaproteobacteria bacterium HGW-Gammaproteobacteria-2]|jgi:hypothetical protein|nr:MAG: hypothetical protein CVV12_03630 [Gammaproteobacteria bacterium HGW-Gammaproteobacteria-2]
MDWMVISSSMHSSLRCTTLVLVVIVGLLGAATVNAKRMSAQVAMVRTAIAEVHKVDVSLDWPDDADSGQLSIDIAQIDASSLGYRFDKLRWQCELKRDGEGFACAGPVRSAQGNLPSLRLAMSLSHTDALLTSGRTRVEVKRLAAAPDNTRLLLRQVPVAWVQAFMHTLWADARYNKGRVDADFMLNVPEAKPMRVSGPVTLAGLALDTADGMIAAEGLSAKMQLDASISDAASRLALQGSLHGGELLASSLYVALPKQAVSVAVNAERRGNQGWRLHGIRWDDPDALHVEGEVQLDPAFNPLRATLAVVSTSLQDTATRYLSGPIGMAGLDGLLLTGSLRASLDWGEHGASAVSVALDKVNAVAADGRFALADVSGELAWARAGDSAPGTIGWGAAAIYGLGFGAGSATLQSKSGEIALLAPVAVPLLGGVFRLNHFALTPRQGDQGARIRLGMKLTDLDLGKLSQRLGWPPFTGTVGGTLADAQYTDNRLSFKGGITISMFDGEVRINDMVMERPFGVAPMLAADIVYDQLDLQPLTAAFGFGEITGRLDGKVGNLRLLDWAPVQFDADFHSSPGYKGKKKISQRAVRDLTSVGGGGIAAGLQNSMLKMFSNFSYAKLGLKCTLRQNVCHMDGVGSAGQGYTIVDGSGLPRITVVGFSRRVDWPVLLARLKAVTEGQMPTVN